MTTSVIKSTLPTTNSYGKNENINIIPSNKWSMPQYQSQQQQHPVKLMQVPNPNQAATLQHPNFGVPQYPHYPVSNLFYL